MAKQMNNEPEEYEIMGKMDNLEDLIGTETDLERYNIEYEIDEQRLKKLLKEGINFIPKPLVLLEFKIKEDPKKVIIKKLVPKWNKNTNIVQIGYCKRGVVRRDYKIAYRGPGIVLSWKAGKNL